jgi:hypothetical protein
LVLNSLRSWLVLQVYEFDAAIQKHESMDAAYIEFPYDVEKEFGVKGQVKVLATFDGHQYRGSLAKMGLPFHCLGMTQNIRKSIGKQPGDTVHVVIQLDTEPRIIQIPDDFQQQLTANPLAQKFFMALSYSHQKEYVQWIESAKKVETREKRIRDAVAMLLNREQSIKRGIYNGQN